MISFKTISIYCYWLIFILLIGCSSKEEIRLSALHYFKQGNQALEKKDYQHALFFYERAIDLDDETAEFHYNQGLAYYQAGRYEDAIKAFEESVELQPKWADNHYNMALSYNRLYRLSEAEEHYRKYQSLLKPKKEKAPTSTTNTATATASPAPPQVTKVPPPKAPKP